MKLGFIEEPELEFGTSRSIDIRFGILNFNPFDVTQPRRPAEIKLGVVGTTQSIDGVTEWIEKLRSEVPAKESTKPNLFPHFPGFDTDTPFKSKAIIDAALNASISHKDIFALKSEGNYNKRVTLAVNLFSERVEQLSVKGVDVIVCAMPQELIDTLADKIEDVEEAEDTEDEEEIDSKYAFHDMLKAKVMRFGIPIQVIRPSTWDETQKKKDPDAKHKHTQDEATRAWNFMTAIYYKAQGIPWRMAKNDTDLDACYVGISFYKSLDQESVQTSIAQVFNERGYGIIVRGGKVKITKENRQPHLTEEDTYILLKEALTRYRNEHQNLPARIVVHKSSQFNKNEIAGAERAMTEVNVANHDLLSLSPSFIRLFRKGYYPPLRGTVLTLDDKQRIIYTRGSVNLYEEYPGMYVPRSLLVRYDSVNSGHQILDHEIMALTKMNWNNTQLDSLMPLTIRASKQVGTILKYLGPDETMQARYSYFM